MPENTLELLRETLIHRGLVQPNQMNQAIERQKEQGGPLFNYLSDLHYISDDKILEFVSSETGIPPVRIAKYQIPKSVIDLISKELATTHGIVPVTKLGNVLTVAMAEPWDNDVLEEIQHATGGLTVSPALATREDLHVAIDRFYANRSASVFQDVMETMDDSEVHWMDSNEATEGVTDTSILLSITDQEPVVRLTNTILSEGIRRRASDIFIEPEDSELVVRYRVDGTLQDGPHPPKSMHQGVISRLKIMATLDIAEQRLPQDGRLKMKINQRWVEFRLSTIPSYFGEKGCLRILDPDQVQLDLTNLGFDKENLKQIKAAATKPYGMILVCGPTGSGKTTTLYSILKHVDAPEKNLVTVEDPVEYHIDGVNQVNVRPEVNLTFASALRAILRQDPDVILIGEIRDSETMDISVKAALTGHLVLSTLHTNTAAGSITRLLNMGIEPFLITASFIMIASQRLVRRLCDKCKEAFEPSAEYLKILRFPQGKKVRIFRAKGCDRCKGKGYQGRESVAEIIMMSPKIRDRILNHASQVEIKKVAREEGMITLRESAIKKVLAGVTSLDEALRVTAKDEEDS